MNVKSVEAEMTSRSCDVKVSGTIPDVVHVTCGRGSLVVKVTNSWTSFSPGAAEDPRYRGGRCTLKYVEAETSFR
ncbi:hypothetical protein TNCV_1941611 [Trichonephila clavipes]|uniref:Uncharacterized protein n=1 Tax=Trichonephila clavipes TaxID=2585209 RepID=A0A8X6SJ31_TRICX|nr:hypothetical protein TNCV_1941611 [Trichonephila clavipes]